MGRFKSRSGATAATPAEADTKTPNKRPNAKHARAAAPATSIHHAKPRPARAVHSRTPVTRRAPLMAQTLLPQARPSWQDMAAAPVAEPSLWQELSQPIKRRLARRQHDLSVLVTRQLARLRLAAQRMQLLGARAWQRGVEQWQAVLRDLRRRQRALALRARRKLRRSKANIINFIVAVWRDTQANTLRALRTAYAWFCRAIDSVVAAARCMQRLGARAWQRCVEQWQAVLRDLRRRWRALALSAWRKLRRSKADIVNFIAAVGRETQTRTLRGLRAAYAWFRRTIDSVIAAAERAIEQFMARINECVVQPVLRPIRQIQRETVAITLAALAVTIVSVAWLAVYVAVVPARATSTPVVRIVPVTPAAPAKAFTARAVTAAIITPASAAVDVPDAYMPAARPADGGHDAAPAPVVVLPQAAAPLPSPDVHNAAPVPAKRKAARTRAGHEAAPQRHQRRARGSAAKGGTPRSRFNTHQALN